jgi:iron(III) transport system substrate-binding protein
VYPDQGDEELGTLFIPNTVAIIEGGPHSEAARKVIDFLLSPEVEQMLAEGPAAQIPLNPKVTAKTQVKTPRNVKAMEVDWEQAADQWTAAARFIRDVFTAP